jgi:hypothetical protein
MIAPEWSHKIESGAVRSRPVSVSIRASEQECRDLARRLKVQEIRDLFAEIVLQRQNEGNVISAKGRFGATVVQFCVSTLDPVIQKIEEKIESWFAEEDDVIPLNRVRRERLSGMLDSELPMPDERDDPEQVIDGMIDVAELVTQNLSLAIDPYPRAESAPIPPPEEENIPGRPNPFEALKDWKFQKEKEKS